MEHLSARGTFILLLCGIIYTVAGSGSMEFYMDDECGNIINMETRALESVRIKTTNRHAYLNNMDCVMYIKAPEGKYFEVKILQNYVVNSPDCEKDYFQIYDGPTLTADSLPGLPKQVCSQSILKSYYTSSTGDLVVRFKSDKLDSSDGVRILISAFRQDPDGQCHSNEFQCKSSKRCISEQLVCDYYDDCSDGSDDCSLPTGVVIGISVGVTLAVIIVIGIITCICCFRKSRRRSGSTKQLSYENSEEHIAPVDDADYSEIHYRPPSIHRSVYSLHSAHSRPTSVYSVSKSEPYIITETTFEPADYTKTRQVFITAPPEVTHLSAY